MNFRLIMFVAFIAVTFQASEHVQAKAKTSLQGVSAQPNGLRNDDELDPPNESGNPNGGGQGDTEGNGNGNENNGQTGGQGQGSGTGNQGEGVGNTCGGNQGNSGTNGCAAGGGGTQNDDQADGNNGNGGGDGGQGDNGNDDGGDSGENGEGQGEGESPVSSQEPSEELKFKWQPALYLDFDLGRKVTNMTLHNQAIERDSNTLVVGDYSGGLRLERYCLLEGGVGVSGYWWYENASDYKEHLTKFVGLIPIKGSQSKSIQYAQSVEELNSLPLLRRPPEKADELKSWAIGDSVNYMRSGGLIYFAGFKYYYAKPTITSVAKGTWSVFVQKNSSEKVYVKITKGRLSSLTASVNGTLVSVGVSKFKDADTAFSFLIDISTEVGRKAYEDLVRGNVGAIQELSINHPEVQYIDLQKSQARAKFFHLTFGLPVIMNTTFSTGKIHSFSQTDIMLNNSTANVNYGVYLKEQRNKFFGNHSEKTTAFTGANYTITEKDGTQKQGYFGQYSIDLGDENASGKNVRSFVSELIKKTGMRKQLAINVPSGDFNYAGAHFEVIFSQTQTDMLMKAAKQAGEIRFVSSNMRSLSDYFNTTQDPLGLCPGTSDEYVACVDKTKAETEVATRKMWNALVRMAGSTKNPAIFAAAFADFGKGLSENAFTLQTAMFAAGEGLDIYFRLVGAIFSLYETYLQTTATPGEFKVVSLPGQKLPINTPFRRGDRQRGIIVTPNDPIYSPVNP